MPRDRIEREIEVSLNFIRKSLDLELGHESELDWLVIVGDTLRIFMRLWCVQICVCKIGDIVHFKDS